MDKILGFGPSHAGSSPVTWLYTNGVRRKGCVIALGVGGCRFESYHTDIVKKNGKKKSVL